MANLKYYVEERERYADVPREKPSREEILTAVRKLCRHFKLPAVNVEFTSGNRNSHFSPGRNRLRFNMDWTDWRTVAHEVAHLWDWTDRKKKVGALKQESLTAVDPDRRNAIWKKISKIQKRKWHASHHARFIDRVFAYIQKKDWELGALRKKVEERQEAAAVREQEREVQKSQDTRIARRQAQVQRLERKIKALTTRLKKARRSLTALERAAARRSAPVSAPEAHPSP